MASPRSGVAMPFSSSLTPRAFRTTPITPLRFVLGRATRVYFHRRHGDTERTQASRQRELPRKSNVELTGEHAAHRTRPVGFRALCQDQSQATTLRGRANGV